MRRNFSNPELKISSTIIFIIMIAALSTMLFIQRLYYNSLKEDYIKSLGAVTVRVIEKDPGMEGEIVPIIVKGVSEEDANKGEAVLSQYGLTKNLENSLFPYYKNTFFNNTISIILLFISILAALIFLNYFQYSVLYERIRELTLGAKRVVEGDYNLSMNENKEGDFSKLVSAFNDMRKTISGNIGELKKEKVFLVNILSDISHQLKTPLSSMIVYNDILINKELSKEQSSTFLTNNQNQLLRMKNLIQNMLKLAKLDAKAIQLQMEEESLNDTIQEALDVLESKAMEENVQMNFNYAEEIVFSHDKLWLQEALINIIKNAIEHSFKNGMINIELIQNPIYIRITVADNGSGISEEDLPNIFKRFYKARNSNKNDSVGIGLALAKSIIESHKAIIEAFSKLEEGTKFVITFMKY